MPWMNTVLGSAPLSLLQAAVPEPRQARCSQQSYTRNKRIFAQDRLGGCFSAEGGYGGAMGLIKEWRKEEMDGGGPE